jgi:Family of unknown function (DUF5670)
VFTTRQTGRLLSLYPHLRAAFFRAAAHVREPRTTKYATAHRRCAGARKLGDENVLGIIAAVLIVLWLLAFFAFHITAGLIHIVLVVGIILLLVHLLRGS